MIGSSIPSAHTRYPGAQPFADDRLSRRLFFGRENESVALLNQVTANRLTVLFARSGLGKTSLLNAGVIDELRRNGFLPLTIRVNDGVAGALEAMYQAISIACAQQGIEYVPGPKTSLWHFFKVAQFWSHDELLTPILIFDQFEELFTLQSEDQRNAFLDQLSYLVRGVRPEPAAASSEDGTDESLSQTPPGVKIVMSLREDFLASLEEMADRIPEILDQRFRLLPMGREQATQALLEPAKVMDAGLVTHPFAIDPGAQDMILDFLERRCGTLPKRSSNPVEPFQLQLICQHIEETARTLQHDGRADVTIGVSDIGGEAGLRKLLKGFYQKQVAAVPGLLQRSAVRRLCSEFLINPQGRRLRMEESEIRRLTGVKPPTLQVLVDGRLLRRDQSADGQYYELSHDSLIVPVLDSRRVWFWVKSLWLLILTLVAVIGTLMFGVTAIAFAWQLISELGIPIAGMAIVTAVGLWIVSRWGFRKFRAFREMWRRSRI